MKIDPTALAQTAQEFSPIFIDENEKGWDSICKLVATHVAQEYKVPKDRIRVFLLHANRGGNEIEDSLWPVVAKNTEEGIKEVELAVSRGELRSIVQDFEDIKDRVQRASGSVRKSTSTKRQTVYGTAGVDAFSTGTLSHVLKLAINTESS